MRDSQIYSPRATRICFRPLGLRFRPMGLRFRPMGLRFRPVGLRFRPQGLRSSVFVFGSSFSTHPVSLINLKQILRNKNPDDLEYLSEYVVGSGSHVQYYYA